VIERPRAAVRAEIRHRSVEHDLNLGKVGAYLGTVASSRGAIRP
jgi:hypothetical protein